MENYKLLFVTSMLDKNYKKAFKLFGHIFELYSKENKQDEIYDILWCIYYDFYAINNHRFQEYMIKKYLNWIKTKDISPLLCVIKNMIRRNASSDVFLMRKYMEHGNMTKMYVGRRPTKLNWLDNFEKKYHELLRAIYNKDYENIAYLVNKIKSDEELYTFHKVFMRYMMMVQNEDKYIITYGPGTETYMVNETEFSESSDKIIDLIKKVNYKNKKHMFLCCICFSYTCDSENDISCTYVLDNSKDKELYNSFSSNNDDISNILNSLTIDNKTIYRKEIYDKIFNKSVIPFNNSLRCDESGEIIITY